MVSQRHLVQMVSLSVDSVLTSHIVLFIRWSLIQLHVTCQSALCGCKHHRSIYIQCICKVFRPPWLFPHFATLQPYLKMYSIYIFSSLIYTKYPIITKRKQVFRTLHKYSPFAIRHEIELRCIHSIDHPWDVSTTWLESTWGKFN